MTLEFCSISMDRSKKDSSREETYEPIDKPQGQSFNAQQHTVSQVKHRVSLVSTPSNSLCTRVASCGLVPEFEPVATVGGVFEDVVALELDTAKMGQ